MSARLKECHDSETAHEEAKIWLTRCVIANSELIRLKNETRLVIYHQPRYTFRLTQNF